MQEYLGMFICFKGQNKRQGSKKITKAKRKMLYSLYEIQT